MKLLTSISAALPALGLLNSYAAASTLAKRYKPALYDEGTRTVDWQMIGYAKVVLHEFTDSFTIEERDGVAIVTAQPDGAVKWDYPVTYYIAQVKDLRPGGCTAGWTLNVLGEGDEAENSWIDLLPMCKDWTTGHLSEEGREESRQDFRAVTTVVGEKVKAVFRHPECQVWDVEEVESGVFRPKCRDWKHHVGGDFEYRHYVRLVEVEASGWECMDWRVDVDTRRTGKRHEQTIAMPFCNDPGSLNAIFLKDGETDIAFRALSEDTGMYEKSN